MKLYLHRAATLLLILIPASSSAQPDSGVGQAEQIVTVTYDPTLQFSYQLINEVTGSKDVAGVATSELTGEPISLRRQGDTRLWISEKTGNQHYAWADVTSARPEAEGRLSVTLRVAIQEGSSKQAEKYVQLVTSRLNEVLAEMSRREYERKLSQLENELEQSQRAADEARETQNAIHAQVGPLVSSAILEGLVADLKKQQQSLELELAGMKGRAEALQNELAKAAEQVKKQPAADEVLRNLSRVVDLRNQQLAEVRQAAEAGAPGGERINVVKAEEQVVLAQIELAQAQRALTRPNAEQLDRLNSELSRIAVSRVETEAKLEYVTKQLDENTEELHREAMAKPRRQQLERQIDTAAKLQTQVQQQARELLRFKATFRPARVEVFELTLQEKTAKEAKK